MLNTLSPKPVCSMHLSNGLCEQISRFKNKEKKERNNSTAVAYERFSLFASNFVLVFTFEYLGFTTSRTLSRTTHLEVANSQEFATTLTLA
jgi:hypothetical protein